MYVIICFKYDIIRETKKLRETCDAKTRARFYMYVYYML